MPGYVWAALAVFVAGLAGGGAWAGLQGVRAWQAGRLSLGRMRAQGRALSQQTAEIRLQGEKTGRAGSQLALAVGDLRRALARLGVILAAVGEAQLLVDRLRWLYPRK